MRISGTHASPPAVNPPGRSSGMVDSAPVPVSDPVPAPVAAPETSEGEPPAEGKAHGLVRAADHSHRSDVAALGQWINHPELRTDLALPDLSAEHKGNGFQQAVAAYEAVIAIGNPTPTTAPVVTDPAPLSTDAAPVIEPG